MNFHREDPQRGHSCSAALRVADASIPRRHLRPGGVLHCSSVSQADSPNFSLSKYDCLSGQATNWPHFETSQSSVTSGYHPVLLSFLGSLDQEDHLEQEMETPAVFLPGESHGLRCLEGCSPRGCKELDTTEQLSNLG